MAWYKFLHAFEWIGIDATTVEQFTIYNLKLIGAATIILIVIFAPSVLSKLLGKVQSNDGLIEELMKKNKEDHKSR